MDNKSISYCDKNKNRKSSSATVVPPTPRGRKASMLPLKINCKDTADSNVFYDTGSMNDISPTTIVPSRRNSPVYNDFASSSSHNHQNSSFLSSIKLLLHKLKVKKSKEPKSNPQPVTNQEKSLGYHNRKKLGQDDENSTTTSNNNDDMVARHSYSDPHLSPGSTAVGYDDDEERIGYFGTAVSKKKKSPRRLIAAILMILFGALIAVTFVLVGLGKALGGNNAVSSSQQQISNSNTTIMLPLSPKTQQTPPPSSIISSSITVES